MLYNGHVILRVCLRVNYIESVYMGGALLSGYIKIQTFINNFCLILFLRKGSWMFKYAFKKANIRGYENNFTDKWQE